MMTQCKERDRQKKLAKELTNGNELQCYFNLGINIPPTNSLIFDFVLFLPLEKSEKLW